MTAAGRFSPEEPLSFLVGPTAVGKSALALELAQEEGWTIVSLDSMQVYRGMDIGTSKPSPAEQARVPHRCIDLVLPSERYDVRRYLADASAALAEIRASDRKALFVGGTGLYLKALLAGIFGGPAVDLALRERIAARARSEGSPALHAELARVDPAAAERIHPNDAKRVVRALEVLEQTGRPLSAWQREWGWHGAAAGVPAHRIVGLDLETNELEPRIHARIHAMLERGWAEEARAIRDGGGFSATAIQALGYRAVLDLADGKRERAEVEEELVRATKRFVRRQRTWFRSFPGIRWLDAASSDVVARAALALRA